MLLLKRLPPDNILVTITLLMLPSWSSLIPISVADELVRCRTSSDANDWWLKHAKLKIFIKSVHAAKFVNILLKATPIFKNKTNPCFKVGFCRLQILTDLQVRGLSKYCVILPASFQIDSCLQFFVWFVGKKCCSAVVSSSFRANNSVISSSARFSIVVNWSIWNLM